jgi:hypothetical protein
MTAVSSPELRRFVRRGLIDATGVAAPEAPALAAAFTLLCRSLHPRLQPLFGTVAVSALFARALHLAVAEFPWLATVVHEDGESCSVEHASTIEHLADGLAALLANDIGLLSTFIGEDIVLPLVQQAWATFAASEQAAKTEGDA